MKLGSLFDGAGTCPYAASLCGIKPVWASEIEPFPIAVSSSNFPSMIHLGDITGTGGQLHRPARRVRGGAAARGHHHFRLPLSGPESGRKESRSGWITVRAVYGGNQNF